MRAEHVTLIKKAIRMLDYMRTDLVRILGESQPGTADGNINALRPSPLYAAYDAAVIAKDGVTITDDEGKHVADCPCFGCTAQREPHTLGAKLTPGQVAKVQAGELNPFHPDAPITALDSMVFRDKDLPEPIGGLQAPDAEPGEPRTIVHETDEFAPPPPPPAPRELTEYERRKAELHAQRGTAFGGQVCIAAHAPAGVRCTCPRCMPGAA